MKKLFVSVPMKGRTEEEIRASIKKMHKIAEVFAGEELELIDSYVEDNPPGDNNQAIWYLGESLKKLAGADVFITISDHWSWDGCFIENQVAERYGIQRFCVPEDIVINNYQEVLRKAHPICDCANACAVNP